MGKITAIKEAKWYVEICGRHSDKMYWEAKTNMELGFYDNKFMQIDEGTSEYAKSSWLEFAEENNVKNYEYVE